MIADAGLQGTFDSDEVTTTKLTPDMCNEEWGQRVIWDAC
jgi:hypothetical protein